MSAHLFRTTPTPGLAGALCVGEHELFDSTDPIDHREARKLCAECPVALACASVLIAIQRDSHACGLPSGTWAGRLYGFKGNQLMREAV